MTTTHDDYWGQRIKQHKTVPEGYYWVEFTPEERLERWTYIGFLIFLIPYPFYLYLTLYTLVGTFGMDLLGKIVPSFFLPQDFLVLAVLFWPTVLYALVILVSLLIRGTSLASALYNRVFTGEVPFFPDPEARRAYENEMLWKYISFAPKSIRPWVISVIDSSGLLLRYLLLGLMFAPMSLIPVVLLIFPVSLLSFVVDMPALFFLLVSIALIVGPPLIPWWFRRQARKEIEEFPHVRRVVPIDNRPSTLWELYENKGGWRRKQSPVPFEEPLGPNTRFRLGQNLALSPDERKGHTHVLGMTGMGKSKALESWIMQDIEAGRGVGVIDPHGSLVENLLKRLADVPDPDIASRLVLIDPLDSEVVVGLNPLDRLEGETYQRHAQVLIEIFSVLWENWETSRWLQEYTRYSAWAMAESGWTMVEMIQFLEDEEFRLWVRKQIESPPLMRWVDWYHGLKSGQQDQETRSTRNRLRDFTDHEHLRQIIGQRKTTIDLRDVLEGENKILLVNLRSKELWGGAYELLGSLILTLLQLSAFRRGDIGGDDHRRLYLYVDEFHTFANETFVKMMGEIRKYGLTLTLANQDLSQLDRVDGLRGAVLGNCANKICFQLGNKWDAETMTQQLFALTGKMTKEERRRWRMIWKIPVLETDRDYYRLPEEEQLYKNILMGKGEDGLVEREFVYRGSKNIAQRDETVFVPDGTASEEEKRDMIRYSVVLQQYARRHDEVKQELAQRVALIKQMIDSDDEDDEGPVLREQA